MTVITESQAQARREDRIESLLSSRTFAAALAGERLVFGLEPRRAAQTLPMDVAGGGRAAAAAAHRPPEPGARRRLLVPRPSARRADHRDDRPGRRRELRALPRAALGRLPAATRARDVCGSSLAPSRLRPEGRCRLLRVGVARGVAEHRLPRASRERRGRGARRERLRRIRRRLEPRSLAGDPCGRLHGRRHGPLRARRRRWSAGP